MEKKRVAGYVRVRNEASLNMALGIQVGFLKYSISRRDDWQLVDIYADSGYGGKENPYPMYKKMIDAAETRKFDYIAVKQLSRFGGDKRDALATIERLRSIGIGVFFIQENLDTLSADAESMLKILRVMVEAENEYRNILNARAKVKT